MFAAANTSNGAPSWSCLAMRPVEPKLKITFCPLFFSYAAPTSLNASARSDAAATRSGGSTGGAACAAPAKSASARLILVDDGPHILSLEGTGDVAGHEPVQDLQLM